MTTLKLSAYHLKIHKIYLVNVKKKTSHSQLRVHFPLSGELLLMVCVNAPDLFLNFFVYILHMFLSHSFVKRKSW